MCFFSSISETYCSEGKEKKNLGESHVTKHTSYYNEPRSDTEQWEQAQPRLLGFAKYLIMTFA